MDGGFAGPGPLRDDVHAAASGPREVEFHAGERGDGVFADVLLVVGPEQGDVVRHGQASPVGGFEHLRGHGVVGAVDADGLGERGNAGGDPRAERADGGGTLSGVDLETRTAGGADRAREGAAAHAVPEFPLRPSDIGVRGEVHAEKVFGRERADRDGVLHDGGYVAPRQGRIAVEEDGGDEPERPLRKRDVVGRELDDASHGGPGEDFVVDLPGIVEVEARHQPAAFLRGLAHAVELAHRGGRGRGLEVEQRVHARRIAEDMTVRNKDFAIGNLFFAPSIL